MTLYTDLRDGTANSLLTSFGTTASLRTIAQTYDVATGIAANVTTDTTIKVALTKAKGKTAFREENIARSNLVMITGAKEINAAGITPNVNDKIVYNSKVYSILEIDEVAPAGVAVIYKFLVMD